MEGSLQRVATSGSGGCTLRSAARSRWGRYGWGEGNEGNNGQGAENVGVMGPRERASARAATRPPGQRR
jgi:hypothetical protein